MEQVRRLSETNYDFNQLLMHLNNELKDSLDSNYKTYCYLVVKRFFDIVLSLFGLILLSPLFLIIGVVIKIYDGGSIFYKHQRVGLNDTPLYIWKFRTMKENSGPIEEILTPEQLRKFKINYKLEDDPRVTPIGKFLRNTSLDELPQLWNILIGNLSLVGPRPVLLEETERYGSNRELFLSCKPGLTGLWQVCGRSSISYDQRIQLELLYCRKHSLWLDFHILFATIAVVLNGDGAC